MCKVAAPFRAALFVLLLYVASAPLPTSSSPAPSTETPTTTTTTTTSTTTSTTTTSTSTSTRASVFVEDFYHGVHDGSFENVFAQTSDSATTWVPYSTAAANGNTGSITIALNYELAEGVDANQTCSTVGQIVRLAGYDDAAKELPGAGGAYECTAADVATPAKVNTIKSYASSMASYVSQLISVPKMWSESALRIHTDADGAAYTGGMTDQMLSQVTATTFSGDIDLVIMVSMRPYSGGPGAGVETYSTCLVRNQFRRCVVANLNFCAAAVVHAPADGHAAAIETRGLIVAVHEVRTSRSPPHAYFCLSTMATSGHHCRSSSACRHCVRYCVVDRSCTTCTGKVRADLVNLRLLANGLC